MTEENEASKNYNPQRREVSPAIEAAHKYQMSLLEGTTFSEDAIVDHGDHPRERATIERWQDESVMEKELGLPAA